MQKTQVMNCTLSIQQLLETFQEDLEMQGKGTKHVIELGKSLKEIEIGQRKFEHKIEILQVNFQYKIQKTQDDFLNEFKTDFSRAMYFLNEFKEDFSRASHDFQVYEAIIESGVEELKQMQNSIKSAQKNTLDLMKTTQARNTEIFFNLVGKTESLRESILDLNEQVAKMNGEWSENNVDTYQHLRTIGSEQEKIKGRLQYLQEREKSSEAKLAEIDSQLTALKELKVLPGDTGKIEILSVKIEEKIKEGFDEMSVKYDKILEKQNGAVHKWMQGFENFDEVLNESIDNVAGTFDEKLQAKQTEIERIETEAKTKATDLTQALEAEVKRSEASLQDAKTSFGQQIAAMREETKMKHEALEAESKRIEASLTEAKTSFKEDLEKFEEIFDTIDWDAMKKTFDKIEKKYDEILTHEKNIIEMSENEETRDRKLTDLETKINTVTETLKNSIGAGDVEKKVQEMKDSQEILINKKIAALDVKLSLQIATEMEQKMKTEIADYIKENPELMAVHQSTATKIESLDERYRLMNDRLEKASKTLNLLGEKPLAKLREDLRQEIKDLGIKDDKLGQEIKDLEIKDDKIETKLINFETKLTEIAIAVMDLGKTKPDA